EDVSVAAIIAAVEESLDATRCGGSADCQGGARCLTHELWTDLSQHLDDFLGAVSLASLTARAAIRDVAARQDRDRPGRIDARILQ
ncbi:MAG: Rrf2 family transcriptional regulator, partial [Pseudomonadales bacterium]|nr:Rrf2 family transcriptional regulator [Pseudomonadales bacterium]